MVAGSPAEGISRRAVIGGGLALGLAGRAGATTIVMPEARTPSATYVGSYPDPVVAIGRFVGIRYGRAARFRPPTAEPDSRLPVLADRFGPACPQPGDRYQPQGEDCLFLNVWTPQGGSARARPVMVYIHGGAYATGSVTDPRNNGAALAARGGVVVVTINHRLNALGYLYLARLDPRFPDSGNAGQLDLILALKWIQRNIAGFGGDPGNVTLFGQSGGGAKIATLMAMPEAAGLFHKAITMSGQQVTASGPLNATKRAAAVLEKLGDNDPARVPVAALIEALAATDPILGGGVYMGPVLDMRHLSRHPFWPDAAPQSLGIPMLQAIPSPKPGDSTRPITPNSKG